MIDPENFNSQIKDRAEVHRIIREAELIAGTSAVHAKEMRESESRAHLAGLMGALVSTVNELGIPTNINLVQYGEYELVNQKRAFGLKKVLGYIAHNGERVRPIVQQYSGWIVGNIEYLSSASVDYKEGTSTIVSTGKKGQAILESGNLVNWKYERQPYLFYELLTVTPIDPIRYGPHIQDIDKNDAYWEQNILNWGAQLISDNVVR